MRKPDEEDFYKIEDALPLVADTRGVYWHEDGPSWTAMKRYGNVVLAWDADERALDDRFERLHTVLTGLGQAPAEIRAKLGGEEPRTGSTRVVDRGQSLRLPKLEVRLTKVQTGQVVIPPNDYGLVRRAKGRYVLAAVVVKNVGDEPLRGLYDARLQVGDTLYEQDSEATYTVTPLHAFPLAPKASAPAAVVFDVPAEVAERAAREGVLAFPSDDASFASIRLTTQT